VKLVRTLFFLALMGFAVSASAQIVKEEVSARGMAVDFTKSVSVFPNPATEYIHIKFEQPIAVKSKVTVHNIIGNALDVERENIDDHELRLRIKDLPVGYYLLAVREEETNSVGTVKFLKR
jgi:hypothetical protein